MINLANAVVSLGTTAEANHAGNQLSADPHNNGATLAVEPALDVLNVVTDHADATRLAMNAQERGLSAGESGSDPAAWAEGFGGAAHQSQEGQFSGYGMTSEGLVAGLDTPVADSPIRVGGVFAYTHASLEEHGDRQGDHMGLDSYGVLGYASYLGTRAYADLLGGVLFDKFDTHRVIDFTGFSGVANGDHDGRQWVAKLDAGYRFPLGEAGSPTTLTPVWGVTYSHLNQNGYTETGGDGAALKVYGESSNSFKGEAGLKLERSFATGAGSLVPGIRLTYRHEFDGGSQMQTASFSSDETNAAFSTQTLRPVVNSGLLSAGLTLLGDKGMTVTLKYDAEIASGFVAQSGSLRVRWAF